MRVLCSLRREVKVTGANRHPGKRREKKKKRTQSERRKKGPIRDIRKKERKDQPEEQQTQTNLTWREKDGKRETTPAARECLFAAFRQMQYT